MGFVNSLLHKGLVALGYTIQGLATLNEIGLEAIHFGVPLPGWARIAIPMFGVIATKLARILPTVGELQPSPTEPNDQDEATAKAAGAAGAAAAKGPFKRS